MRTARFFSTKSAHRIVLLLMACASCHEPSAATGSGSARPAVAGDAGRARPPQPSVPLPPGVHPGSPTVTGPLAADEVIHVVERNLAPVAQCYDQSRAHDPNASGRVVMHFVIDPNGQVTRSDISEAPASLVAAADCISRSVVSWRFAPRPSQESVSVLYPFELRMP